VDLGLGTISRGSDAYFNTAGRIMKHMEGRTEIVSLKLYRTMWRARKSISKEDHRIE